MSYGNACGRLGSEPSISTIAEAVIPVAVQLDVPNVKSDAEGAVRTNR